MEPTRAGSSIRPSQSGVLRIDSHQSISRVTCQAEVSPEQGAELTASGDGWSLRRAVCVFRTLLAVAEDGGDVRQLFIGEFAVHAAAWRSGRQR